MSDTDSNTPHQELNTLPFRRTTTMTNLVTFEGGTALGTIEEVPAADDAFVIGGRVFHIQRAMLNQDGSWYLHLAVDR